MHFCFSAQSFRPGLSWVAPAELGFGHPVYLSRIEQVVSFLKRLGFIRLSYHHFGAAPKLGAPAELAPVPAILCSAAAELGYSAAEKVSV